ncbi:C15C7.7, partial [Symbiodinium pilosum]
DEEISRKLLRRSALSAGEQALRRQLQADQPDPDNHHAQSSVTRRVSTARQQWQKEEQYNDLTAAILRSLKVPFKDFFIEKHFNEVTQAKRARAGFVVDLYGPVRGFFFGATVDSFDYKFWRPELIKQDFRIFWQILRGDFELSQLYLFEGWNGERPETSWKPLLRDLELWEAVTDLPKAKRGVKLVQALSGPAKEAVQSLTVSDLIAEDGLKKVTKALKDAFAPYQETALPRAMESAIFGAARSHKESLPEYIVRFQQAQATLRSEGVDLPNKAAGYLLYRQANLDRDSEAKLTTWLQGTFFGEQEPEQDEEDEWPEDGDDYFPVWDEAQDSVEPDENDVIDEEDLVDVLASYQDVRQALKQTRNVRGFYPPRFPGAKGKKGHGKGSSFGPVPGKGKGPVTEFFTESVPDAKVSFLTSDHSSADVPFVGVITSSAEAIVDTAAQEGLIGRPALLRLFEALRKFGLKGRWTGEASEARGIGGAAKTLGVVEVPVGIGRVPGVVALTVVTEDVILQSAFLTLDMVLAATDKGQAYRNYLESKKPTAMTPLGMASGSFLEFERAEENLTLMETQVGDLDQTTQNYVRAMISEYRRLKLYEEETRHQSRTFASKQNRTDWEKAASNLKATAIELNNYQAMLVVQRNQDVKDPLDGMTTKRGKVLKRASPNVLDCWIKERQPFCEDYVVAYIVLNEPNLVIGAEFPENYAEADSNVLAQAVKNYLIESFPPVPKLRLKLNGITEFEAWKLMESKRPGHIILDVGNVRNNLDMACRLARHQHGQGGTYAMYLDPKQGPYFEKHHGWQHAIKELGASYETANGATVLRSRKRTSPNGSVEAFPVEVASPEQEAGQEGQDENGVQVQEPTLREKEAIEKLHRNLGHPNNKELSRVLALSRAKPRLVRWAAQEHYCPNCAAHGVLIADQGTEFLANFKAKCSDLGIVLHTIGARAPHQQGRTERHGALFKAVFQKAVWDCPPQDHHEWRLLLRETEAAKNKSFNRSGFSPVQRMMGHAPRTNGEVMSDDIIDPAFLGQGQEMEKLLSARRAAQKAFVEINTSEAVKTALRSRSRVHRRFAPGEVVFVWRSWKEKGVLKPSWVGPAVVLMPEGANAYVNTQGRLWKVCNEHLRLGTSDEVRGIEAVHEVFEDLKQRFDRAGSRIIEDHTQDPLPESRKRMAKLEKRTEKD